MFSSNVYMYTCMCMHECMQVVLYIATTYTHICIHMYVCLDVMCVLALYLFPHYCYCHGVLAVGNHSIVVTVCCLAIPLQMALVQALD